MNILIVALDFKPNSGGVAEYTHQLAKHVHLAGERVMVLSRQMEKDQEFDRNCPYAVKRYVRDVSKPGNVGTYCQNLRTVARALRDHDADVIVGNSIQSEPLICWLLARAHRMPYCVFAYGREVTVHPGQQKAQGRSTLLKRSLKMRTWRMADRVFCISNFTRDLVEREGVPRARTTILYPGVALPEAERSDSEEGSGVTKRLDFEGRKIVLTLSRLVERKGIDTAIRALAMVAPQIPEVLYLIAGDGPYRDTLEKLIGELDLSDHVLMVGPVADADKSRYYRSADLFVMPNRELEDGDIEGFGIVFLEANSYGKPVIAGRSGGAVDAVLDGKTGLLVDPLDIDAVAAAILRLLKDKAYAEQLGRQGRERIIRELSWEKVAQTMQLELEKLV